MAFGRSSTMSAAGQKQTLKNIHSLASIRCYVFTQSVVRLFLVWAEFPEKIPTCCWSRSFSLSEFVLRSSRCFRSVFIFKGVKV